MKPIGPLMIEHRLIEEMIEIIRQRTEKMKLSKTIDIVFIDRTVDFIRTYADKTHHGKEEDILFRDCAKKNMSEENVRLMNELIEDHKYGRRIVRELKEAKMDYQKGNDTINIAIEKLDAIAAFYPQHIEKEDKVFFPNSDEYFTEEERQAMLKEFREFDQQMIHEKYKSVVDDLRGTHI